MGINGSRTTMTDDEEINSYQDAFERQIAKMPDMVFRKLISKKIEKQGIKLSDSIFEKLITHLVQGGKGSFSIPDEDIEFIDNAVESLELKFTKKDKKALKRAAKAFEKSLPELIQKLAKKFSKDIVKRSKLQWLEDYQLTKSQRDRFEARLKYRWRDGLIPLNIMMEVTREFSQSILNRHQETIDTDVFSLTLDTLLGLHVRACQVTAEIVNLLEAGYADGAMARWRTLHEIAVVADLIHDAGDELSRRYMDHNIIDEKKAADKYMEVAKIAGYAPIPHEELEAIEAEYQAVLDKHGKDFRKEYGWASDVVGNPNPRFVDLIKKSNRESLQSYYKIASFNVHANARSLFYRQTSMASHSGLISGSSNAGLDEPGIQTAYLLCQITSNLTTNIDTTLDDIIALQTLVRLRDKAYKGFSEAAKQLDMEDQEYLELSEEYEDFDIVDIEDFDVLGVENSK